MSPIGEFANKLTSRRQELPEKPSWRVSLISSANSNVNEDDFQIESKTHASIRGSVCESHQSI